MDGLEQWGLTRTLAGVKQETDYKEYEVMSV